MPLDLDPIYYTESMVEILRGQGSLPSAVELAGKVLERHPSKEQVRRMKAEMEEEIRLAFERFRNSGRAKMGEA